jgi:hypothetical protein
MTILYSWRIDSLDVINTDAVNNLVANVSYRYIGQTDQASAYVLGKLSIPYNPTANFIEFDSLTRDLVISWLEASINVTTLQSTISEKIDKILNPVQTLNTPWIEPHLLNAVVASVSETEATNNQ